LQPPLKIACAGDRRERHLAKKDDVARGVVLDLLPEGLAGEFNFRSREFGGLCGGPRDYRGETATVLKNRVAVLRTNLFGRKTCQMQHSPEAIASTCKVMTCRCRAEPRIDAAKYQRQAWFENIGKRWKGSCVSHR
jgi:hypothetical protein